jgi:putative ABC transport system permease protein
MTILGTALVVWASILALGLAYGLQYALAISADPLDLIVLRQGSENEISSGFDETLADEMATLEGVERGRDGRPLASPEIVTVTNVARRARAGGGKANLVVRGLTEVGRQLRPGFRIIEGRDIRPGVHEAIASRRVAERFENTALGEEFPIGAARLRIVGIFEAGGSAAESELWTDMKVLGPLRDRSGSVSSVNVRATDAEAKDSLAQRIKNDERFALDVTAEQKYYEDQMLSALVLKVVGYAIALFLLVGAMFAAANTMYAAVASRVREIGTMRAIGFGRATILVSFMMESLLLCISGGVLGCLGTLPFHGLTTGTSNFATFSEITFAFHFGPAVLVQGMAMALLMGLLGGLLPAIRAVRLDIVRALREI